MIVRVPASSANLGSGFDCLGLAWNLYNEIEFQPADSLLINGCDERFTGLDNLAYRGFCAVYESLERPVPPVRISFLKSHIPVSRGLGSSAALIAAGAFAADRMGGFGLSRGELLTICTHVEGHPDNLAPALFGGFTAAAMENGRAFCVQYPLNRSLRFLTAVPDTELSTALARSVMPNGCSRADAVFNLSRTALLIRGLESADMELIRVGLQDRLHQPFRLPLISGAEEFFSLVEELGGSCAAACISGAGSTLLVITDSDHTLSELKDRLIPRFPSWTISRQTPDINGAVIV